MISVADCPPSTSVLEQGADSRPAQGHDLWPLTSLVGVYRMELALQHPRLMKSSSGCRHNSKFSLKQELIKSHQINFKVKVQRVSRRAAGHLELTSVRIINAVTSCHIQTEFVTLLILPLPHPLNQLSSTLKRIYALKKKGTLSWKHLNSSRVCSGLVTVERVLPVKEKEKRIQL